MFHSLSQYLIKRIKRKSSHYLLVVLLLFNLSKCSFIPRTVVLIHHTCVCFYSNEYSLLNYLILPCWNHGTDGARLTFRSSTQRFYLMQDFQKNFNLLCLYLQSQMYFTKEAARAVRPLKPYLLKSHSFHKTDLHRYKSDHNWKLQLYRDWFSKRCGCGGRCFN